MRLIIQRIATVSGMSKDISLEEAHAGMHATLNNEITHV